MSNGSPLSVKVWGEFACFTRPEMKVERVSYPCMTPSAARGVLEAIFWKPEFRWRVVEIEVLKPIRYYSLLRNEVKSKASARSARGGAVLMADEDRTQRHTLALRDVAYVIRAEIELAEHVSGENVAKYRDQFRRRLVKGACYRQPYLGCREFTAFFAEAEAERLASIDQELGAMLLDLDYATDGSGRGRPVFFEAVLRGGRLSVPRLEHMESGHVA